MSGSLLQSSFIVADPGPRHSILMNPGYPRLTTKNTGNNGLQNAICSEGFGRSATLDPALFFERQILDRFSVHVQLPDLNSAFFLFLLFRTLLLSYHCLTPFLNDELPSRKPCSFLLHRFRNDFLDGLGRKAYLLSNTRRIVRVVRAALTVTLIR